MDRLDRRATLGTPDWRVIRGIGVWTLPLTLVIFAGACQFVWAWTFYFLDAETLIGAVIYVFVNYEAPAVALTGLCTTIGLLMIKNEQARWRWGRRVVIVELILIASALFAFYPAQIGGARIGAR